MFDRIRHSRTGLLMAGALALGAMFGGSVVSVASPQATAIHTRSASCGGLDFYPASSSQTWGEDGVLRTSNGPVRCNRGLPNGAVVKSMQFTISDNDPSGKLSYCGLVRANLTPRGGCTRWLRLHGGCERTARDRGWRHQGLIAGVAASAA